jgi:hypothetical protein
MRNMREKATGQGEVGPVCELKVGYVFLYYSIVENRRA